MTTAQRTPSFTEAMDPDSPTLVVKGIAVLGATGSITGATFGVLRSMNPYAIAINMGLNGSILGLSFFGIREYIVSPLLIQTMSSSSPTYAYRLATLQHLEEADEFDRLGMMRSNRLLDSAAAGGLAGGVLSSVARGMSTFPRAAFTSALITTSFQYMANSARVARLQVLASRSRSRTTPPDGPASGLGIAPPQQSTSHGSETVGNSFTESRSEELDQMRQREAAGGSRPLPTKIMDLLTYVSPVRKISDEEYLTILERQRSELVGEMESRGTGIPSATGTTQNSSTGIWANLTSGFGSEGKHPSSSFGEMASQLEEVERKMESLRVNVDRRADNQRVKDGSG